MGSTSEVIARIEALSAERQYLLDCLKVWDAAAEAGYTSDQVKAFSFRPEFLDRDQKRENQRARRYMRPHDKLPYNQNDWHNCARLTTGELVPIPMVKRPVKPLDNDDAAK